MYTYAGTETNADNLEISFVQWTDDVRVTMDTTHTFYPTAASTASFIDTTSYSGTAKFPRTKVSSGFPADITYTEMVALIDAYNTAKTTYETNAAAIKTANAAITAREWWEIMLGTAQDPYSECPAWPGPYVDSDMYNTVS
mmetsp:Transcript_38599/g.58743  ORF Transcript_38599/g.58743 Transcript_38599/m.58743 type:complete len:141 (-) Transcript_38599:368-790(-)